MAIVPKKGITMDHLDYTKYFNFDDHPFRLLPDPAFFFPSEPHVRAKEVLLFGIRRGEGFMVLVGEAGTGKSLLLRMLLKDLPANKETVMIVAPKVSPGGLMRLILDDMGIHGVDTFETALLQRLIEENIIKLAEQDKELLIVIDEAQNLPLDTLEQLRLLSNVETGKKKLLQILLVGQPELVNLINSHGLGQLAQRISIMEQLRPFTETELEEYVTFRINKAGGAGLRIEKNALKALQKASNGIPRLVNKIMDRALLVAASLGATVISRKVVEEAVATLPHPVAPVDKQAVKGENLIHKRVKWALATTLVTACLVLSVYVVHTQDHLFQLFMPPVSRFLHKGSATELRLTPSIDTKKRFGVVRKKRAFIREGPGMKYPRFAIVSLGDRLNIEGEKGVWIKVKVHDSKGTEKMGWIRRDLLIIEK